jgi:hypothetical protein
MLAEGPVGSEQDESRVGNFPVHHEFRVVQQLLCVQVVQGFVAGLLCPHLSHVLHGAGVQIIKRRPGTDLSRVVGASLIEDPPELIRRHCDQVLARSHQVHTVTGYGHTYRAGGHLEHEHPTVGMVEDRGLDA